MNLEDIPADCWYNICKYLYLVDINSISLISLQMMRNIYYLKLKNICISNTCDGWLDNRVNLINGNITAINKYRDELCYRYVMVDKSYTTFNYIFNKDTNISKISVFNDCITIYIKKISVCDLVYPNNILLPGIRQKRKFIINHIYINSIADMKRIYTYFISGGYHQCSFNRFPDHYKKTICNFDNTFVHIQTKCLNAIIRIVKVLDKLGVNKYDNCPATLE